MKLVDILARELKEWPEKFGGFAIQAPVAEGKAVWFSAWEPQPDKDGWRDIGVVEHWAGELAEDRKTAIVTRAQWQAAVEALRNPLPPLKNPLPMPNVVPPKQVAIDWSKAPEGATHFCIADRNWLQQLAGLSLVWENRAGWVNANSQYSNDLSRHECVVSRPTNTSAWSGEGLPPVGTECEFKSVGHHEGPEFKWCIFHGKTKFGGYIIEHYQRPDAPISTADAFDPALTYFRQIRGPEQIAAEERRAAIGEMLKIMQHEACAGDDDGSITAEFLYDAGYRKVDQ